MPLMTLCKYPGCRKPVAYGEKYCEAHKAQGEKREAEAKARRETLRKQRCGSASERGYSYRWQKASKAFLREHPLCVECERNGIAKAATCVDHIIPHRGDRRLFWDVSNWQPLCQECHSRKTAREDGGFGNQF